MRLQSAAAFAALAFAAQLGLMSSVPASRTDEIPSQVPVTPEDVGECVPLPEGHYCIQEGRNMAYLPNFRNQTRLEDAVKEFDDFREMLQTGCSEKVGTLLCFHYFPLCRHDHTSSSFQTRHRIPARLGPCAVTCEQSRRDCEEYFLLQNLSWPPHLDCAHAEFHPRDGICVDGVMDPYPLTTTREPEFELCGSGSTNDSREIPCSSLASPANGQITENGVSAGSEATYECNEGYVLRGDHSRTCQDDGTWSGEAPTCDEILCSDLQSPANGQVQLTGLTVGSEATYECNDGYLLRGNHSRICQDEGTWSGEAPTCDEILCGRLQPPANGQVQVAGQSVGSEATYECDDGYVLRGEDTRTCQDDGTWSGEAPTCAASCDCPSKCKMRVNCNRGTFLRNGYTFAAHVRVQEELPGDNRTFLVLVVHQYLPFDAGSPRMETGSVIHTTDCCNVCSSRLNIQDGEEYLFAGYYDSQRWYLDTQDSLVTLWEDKLARNLASWVRL